MFPQQDKKKTWVITIPKKLLIHMTDHIKDTLLWQRKENVQDGKQHVRIKHNKT